jgi:hypothetical protein
MLREMIKDKKKSDVDKKKSISGIGKSIYKVQGMCRDKMQQNRY